MHGISFFPACITSDSLTEETANSGSRISNTWDTVTAGKAFRSCEISYKNNLKSQTTTNCLTHPFLTPPDLGTLT